MNKFFQLLKVQMMNYWLQGNAKTIRSQLLRSVPLALFILGIASFYAAMLFQGANAFVYPYLIFLAASIVMAISFFTTLSTAQATFFEFKDYDLLVSLPVNKKWISFSKFLSAMVNQWIISWVVLIPVFVVCIAHYSGSFQFAVFYLLGMLLLPAVPVSLGILIALAFRWITAGTRFENLLKNILNVALVIFIIVINFSQNFGMSGRSSESISTVRKIGPGLVNQWFFTPANWFAFGTVLKDSMQLFYLLLVAVISLGIVVTVYLKLFDRIHHRSAVTYHVKNFKLTKAKGGSQVIILVKREFKTLFSNFAASLNIFMMPLMGILAGVTICYFTPQFLVNFLISDGETILLPIIYFLTIFSGMPIYSSSAINIEGTRFWIIRSLPISERKFLMVKHFVGLFMSIIGPMVCLILCSIHFKFDSSLFFTGFILVISLVVAINSFALLMNLLLPKMIYDSPELAIKKGGIGSVLGGVVPYLGSIILFVSFMKSMEDSISNKVTLMLCLAVIVAIMALVLEVILWVYGPRKIRKLG